MDSERTKTLDDLDIRIIRSNVREIHLQFSDRIASYSVTVPNEQIVWMVERMIKLLGIQIVYPVAPKELKP